MTGDARDVHPSSLDVGHPVRRPTQQNHIAGPQVGNEGPRQFPENGAFGVEHQVGIVRCDGSDVGVVNHSRVPALSEDVLFPVNPNPALFFEHVQHFDEIVVLEVSIGPRIHDDFVGLIDVQFVDNDQADDELRHHVKAILWEVKPVHVTGLNRSLKGRQFDEVVHAGRQETRTGDTAHVVASTTDALESGCDVAGTADL